MSNRRTCTLAALLLLGSAVAAPALWPLEAGPGDGPLVAGQAEEFLPLSPLGLADSGPIAHSTFDFGGAGEGPLRPLTPAEIAGRLDALAGSERVRLIHYGYSHEGYPLRAALISTPARLADLEALRRSVALDAAERDGPLVIWIGAAVHGDEASGAEGALALAHHLAHADAGEVGSILESCLLVVDPLQNPDGRRRFIAELNTWNGLVPSMDGQSLAHRSDWPSGRGNHYFMDLNRDWANLSQPETWGRVRLLLSYPPQVTFDLHEMGGQEGYLFSPPREPFHPRLPETTHKWWRVISGAMARAFGARGWTCTTRDWHEEFNPNRGASWPLHLGAVSFLGEQFSTDGAALRLPHGGSIAYRRAVAHQFTAAYALVAAAALNHEAILEDYAQQRERARERRPGEPAAYLIDLESSPERGLRLARNLAWLGLELRRCQEPFRQDEAVNYWREERAGRPFAAGSLILDLDQVLGPLARALLDFDTPMSPEYLDEERRSLEAGEGSRLYEATAWSLAQSHACEVYALEEAPAVGCEPFDPRAQATVSPIAGQGSVYALVLGADEPGFARALSQLQRREIPCWGAGAPFVVDGRRFPAGSVVVKRAEAPPGLDTSIKAIAEDSGVRFHGLMHALVEEGPDVGARAFRRLFPARVALLAGHPFYQTSFGALWHLFDRELGHPVSLLRLSQLDDVDLDRYNVIILPDGYGGCGETLPAELGEAGLARLTAWVEAGGTLIATGEGCGLLAVGETPISGLRLRRQVLDRLQHYVLDGRPRGGDSLVVSPEEDAWLRRFSPQGAILRADLPVDHWIAGGLGRRVPVMVSTDMALLGARPGEVLSRFARGDALRLSGLLWPEAAERLEGSAYAYREGRGRGQMIAFLGNPAYRAAFHGSARLLVNAALLGPGMGARQPAPW